MPHQTLTFRGIRLHLYALVAVALTVGLVLFGLFVALERRVRELGSVADDYHMASAGMSARIQVELLSLDRSLSALEVIRAAPPEEVRQLAADVDEEYRRLAVSVHLLIRSVGEMAALQEKFGDPEFAASTRRLVDVSDPLEMLMVRGVRRETNLDSRLPALSIVAEQLGRLHLIAHNDTVARIRAIRADNVLYFAAVSAVAIFIGFAASRRSISGIRAVVAKSDANQELLRESESRLRNILDTAAEGIITIDEFGSVTSFNDIAAGIFGYDTDEMIGENIRNLMPPPYRDEHDAYIEKYLETAEKHVIDQRREVVGLRKDGSTFPLAISVTEMQVAGRPTFNGLVRDLSAQKQAEEEIFRLQRALEESANEFYVFDSETLKFSYVNRGATRNLGYTAEALYEMTPLDLKPEFTEESFRQLIAPLLDDTKEDLFFQTVHKRKDESLYPVDVRLSVVKGEKRKSLLAVILDTTQREREEEERLKLEVQVQQAQKLESLGVLAGGIAHDFNNLLVSILGNADLAEQELSPVSPAMTSIKEIETAAVRAAELCRQMLAYSGKGKFVIEPIDLNEVVEEMTHLLDVSISKKAVIKYNLAHNLPAIEVDVTQIRQVIMNLITNASDAIGDKSGVISISTGAMNCDMEYLDKVYLKEGLAEGLYVYLEVADTGCGMDEKAMAKLFDPFFTTKFTGRGLGLAAALGIVRGHSGAIKVYSDLGKGTTFKFLIPASTERSVDLRISKRDDAKAWKGEGTILLVDDEETVLAVGKRLLEAANFSVVTASDGHEALELFHEHMDEIKCVLLDMTMPRMDGEETYRELRRIRDDVPVILSSGYNEQEVTSRFVGKGLAGFIQKPYRLVELKAKIREVLRDP